MTHSQGTTRNRRTVARCHAFGVLQAPTGRLQRAAQELALPRPHHSVFGPIVGALVAGGLIGSADGLAAVRSLPLAPDLLRDGLLVVISVAGLGLLATTAAAAVALVLRRQRPVDRWVGFATGSAVLAVAAGISTHSAILSAGLAVASAIALPRLLRTPVGRPRMVASLVVLAACAVRVAGDSRPRASLPVADTVADAPDLVLVVIDGLRADQPDRPALRGLPAMPGFTALAARGTRYTAAFTPSAHPDDALTAALFAKNPWSGAPASLWAPALTQAGFAVASFGGPAAEAHAAAARIPVRDHDPRWLPGLEHLVIGRLLHLVLGDAPESRSGRRVVSAWQSWLSTVPTERPTATILHFTEPAWPLQAPPPWDTAFDGGTPPATTPPAACSAALEAARLTRPARLRATYDGAVATVDELLLTISATLDARDRPSMLIVSGLRGQPLGEDGAWLNPADSLAPASTQVPLVAVGHGVPKGSVIGAPVSTTDLLPTLLAHSGVDSEVDHSVLPGLVSGRPPRDHVLTLGPSGTARHTAAGTWRSTPAGPPAQWQDSRWVVDDSAPALPTLASGRAAPSGPCTAD